MLLRGIGPVVEPPRLDAAEDLVELLLAHEERVVLQLRSIAVGVEEGERDLVADLDVEERAEGLRRRQAEELGEETRRRRACRFECTMVWLSLMVMGASFLGGDTPAGFGFGGAAQGARPPLQLVEELRHRPVGEHRAARRAQPTSKRSQTFVKLTSSTRPGMKPGRGFPQLIHKSMRVHACTLAVRIGHPSDQADRHDVYAALLRP